jgi:hypothetical protein
MNAEKYAAYRRARQQMIDYLLLKVNEEDWRGVSDAANDIRVLEAKYSAESLFLELGR